MEKKMNIGMSLIACLLLVGWGQAQEQLLGDVIAHDPVMIQQGDTYYVFATGQGIAVWSSKDRIHWKAEAPVFSEPPAWALEAVPTFKGHIWAPDIHYFNGQYYLYYSVSAFGKNTSCIGVATNPTLNPRDPRFKWTDHGKVVQSFPGKTNWNAIDPNLVLDEAGNPYLVFGSFWDGIKLLRLTQDGFQVEEGDGAIPTIASRKVNSDIQNPPAIDDNPKEAGGNAIEAPFIFKKGKYYYLFASIDYCCKGAASTYKMIVGRAAHLAGPYLDDQGKPLAHGGGKLLLEGNSAWYGVGHNAVVTGEGQDFLVFHGYDAKDEGKPKLRIEELYWDQRGWPTLINK